jgi:hypothetical protein
MSNLLSFRIYYMLKKLRDRSYIYIKLVQINFIRKKIFEIYASKV